ncbi:MAG TPA: hypothetical protein VLK85_31740, partial [Ramlibacter sp.]|nr:hypothetical protein [Ramlibacter sp.]
MLGLSLSDAARDQTAFDYDEVLGLYRRHLSRGRAKISEVFGTQMEMSARGAWVDTSDGSR